MKWMLILLAMPGLFFLKKKPEENISEMNLMPPPSNKVLVTLQENGGQLVYIDDFVPRPAQNQVSGLIDKISEGFMSMKSNLVSTGFYKKAVDLTDINCTRAKLLQTLIAETKAGNDIDLYIFGHGTTDYLKLYGKEALTGGVNGNIRSLLADARKTEGPKFNFRLRLVYMCNCVGGTTNDDWIAAGAKTSVGPKCYNAMPEPMITLFMNKFVRENKTVGVASAQAFTESKAAWSVYNSVHNLGLNNPPPSAVCKRFATVFASSEPEIAGNTSLKFNPTALTPVQIAENVVYTGGQLVLNTAETVGTTVGETVETITYNAGSVFDNVTGNAIAEGIYTMKCLKGGRYLKIYQNNCVAIQGGKTVLHTLGSATCDNRFTLKKYGGGYTVKAGGKFMEVKAEDIPFNSGKVQMWEANLPGNNHAPNQIWWFFKIPGHTDKYIVRNISSLKVLDANNNCTSQNDCTVKQYDGLNNDATQVWVLNKVN